MKVVQTTSEERRRKRKKKRRKRNPQTETVLLIIYWQKNGHNMYIQICYFSSPWPEKIAFFANLLTLSRKKNTIIIMYITWKVILNSNLKKIIIGHICYSKQNVVPSPPHTQNLFWIKTCPIFMLIAIGKRLVIYTISRQMLSQSGF